MQGGSWSRIPRPSERRQLMRPAFWWFCQAGESMMPSAEGRRAVFSLKEDCVWRFVCSVGETYQTRSVRWQ